MGLRVLALLLSLFFTACSVYRSDGRKEFESLNFSSASFLSLGCEPSTTSLQKSQEALSVRGFHPLTIENDFQIWSKNLQPHIVAYALNLDASESEVCAWAFEDSSAWENHYHEMIQSLSMASSTQ